MTRLGWFGMCWMMLCLGDAHASGRLQAALISSADKAIAPRIVPVLHGREYLVQEDVLHVPDALPLGSQWGIYRPGRSFPLTEHDHVAGDPSASPFWGMLPVARATVIGHTTQGSRLSIEDGIQEVRAGDYLLARTETPLLSLR
ncbi:hypothetical protein KDD30_16130 [Photobacterium sp. GJ3]|uniref:hypothetical protein n=1 Tax=Photobacterium sp. GJ3 TaxID=2829502 RepID=UPI001B8AA6FD|nr:hypothetical protein [Photobacterium sp. GJ3]QUJ67529.1 hypothetical protein KDD30_16130 [Photobacterium sp. GJ3]